MEGSYFFYNHGAKDYSKALIGVACWAGPYCFGCDISLVTGESALSGKKNPLTHKGSAHYECPTCKRKVNDHFGNPGRLKPTEEELEEQQKRAWPVRFAVAFCYAIPPEQVKKCQKDTPVIHSGGRKMTMDYFRKNVVDIAKFHIVP
ncbi:MAG: hypothetical protein AAB345_04390 [Patescibacteria group bacterium]